MTYEELLKDQTFKEFLAKMNEYIKEGKPIIFSKDDVTDQYMHYQIVPDSFEILTWGFKFVADAGTIIDLIGAHNNSEWEITREDDSGDISFSLTRYKTALESTTFGFDF